MYMSDVRLCWMLLYMFILKYVIKAGLSLNFSAWFLDADIHPKFIAMIRSFKHVAFKNEMLDAICRWEHHQCPELLSDEFITIGAKYQCRRNDPETIRVLHGQSSLIEDMLRNGRVQTGVPLLSELVITGIIERNQAVTADIAKFTFRVPGSRRTCPHYEPAMGNRCVCVIFAKASAYLR